MPPPSFSVNLLYNKSNIFGLLDDVIVLERILRRISASAAASAAAAVTFQKARHLDPREPLVGADVQIHLEVPVYGAIPWGLVNLLLVNPEHWVPAAYDAYLPAFDLLMFRDQASAAAFRDRCPAVAERVVVVPWCSSWEVQELPQVVKRNEWVALLGGSANKAEAMKAVLPHWRSSYPPLTVYTTREDVAVALNARITAAGPVTVICEDVEVRKQKQIAASYGGHVVVSRAEAFGYAAAHAEIAGSFTLMNTLEVFQEYYGVSNEGVAWISLAPETVQAELDAAMDRFAASQAATVRDHRVRQAKERLAATVAVVSEWMEPLKAWVAARKPARGVLHLPPILDPMDCPPITVITPTYNRKKLFDIAFHNLLSTDYPLKKMEWIIIEDNEKAPHLIGEKIMAFQIQVPDLTIRYIPIEGRMSIGEKRNHAVENASHDIVLFMDDDDHYPVTSFRRRVAWLLKGRIAGQPARMVACTTIALYDLLRGTSAVNVPPYDLPLSQRISEATLTFYKSAWADRRFPAVSVAEGEEWIHGREQEVLEIPPQQIIVAFSHGQNQSSRRVPPSQQAPSCFWGFPREYLHFIHGLVGVQIEEETSRRPS